jgi:hypothetical protein
MRRGVGSILLGAGLGGCTALSGAGDFGVGGEGSNVDGLPDRVTLEPDVGIEADASTDAPGETTTDAPYNGPRYRRALTITAGATAVPSEYTFCAVLGSSITGLVGAGKMRADYNDLAVRRQGLAAPRIVEPIEGGSLSVCFRLLQPIAASQSDTYQLEYGVPNASPPNVDPATVFAFYDGFSGAALGNAWLTVGTAQIQSGALRLPQGAENAVRTAAGSDGVPSDATLEMRVRVTDPGSVPIGGSSYYYWFGFQRDDFNPTQPWSVFIKRSGSTVQAEHDTVGGACDTVCVGLNGTQSTGYRFYRITRAGSNVTFAIEEGTPFSAGTSNGDMSIMIRNYMQTSDLLVDWVRARGVVSPEPTSMLGAEQNLP